MKKSGRIKEAEAALRKVALGYPEAHEDFPWGERVIKVKGKVASPRLIIPDLAFASNQLVMEPELEGAQTREAAVEADEEEVEIQASWSMP